MKCRVNGKLHRIWYRFRRFCEPSFRIRNLDPGSWPFFQNFGCWYFRGLIFVHSARCLITVGAIQSVSVHCVSAANRYLFAVHLLSKSVFVAFGIRPSERNCDNCCLRRQRGRRKGKTGADITSQDGVSIRGSIDKDLVLLTRWGGLHLYIHWTAAE